MVSDMETVNLAFRYRLDDYVRAMRSHYASRLRLRLDISLIIGAAVFGIYELWSGSNTLGILMLSVSGVLALMLLVAFFVIPRVTFRSQPKFRDEYALTFTPSGIHFRTAHIDSELQWNMYSRALVDEHSFVLYYGSQQFTLIPKRVFENDGQRHTFERLLAQNVPDILDKTK